MTPDDIAKVRATIRTGWALDVRCADCLGPPTCPNLTDEVWTEAWGRPAPADAKPRRCNCEAWDALKDRWDALKERYPRLKSRVIVMVGSDRHWGQCDLVRETRRPLLCLECAERRLGRRIGVLDLSSCLANYFTAVLAERILESSVKADVSALERLRRLAMPTPRDLAADPYRDLPSRTDCDHGVTFDEMASRGLSADEVRRRWPRLDGDCPLGCGYRGIAYASTAHFVCGDW